MPLVSYVINSVGRNESIVVSLALDTRLFDIQLCTHQCMCMLCCVRL